MTETFIRERRHPRVACAMPAMATVDAKMASGTCRTLSRGGTFFSGTLLPLGEQVELTIHLPKVGPVRAQGEVRYHYAHQDGPGSGITFTRLSPADLDRVTWFVASYVQLRRGD